MKENLANNWQQANPESWINRLIFSLNSASKKRSAKLENCLYPYLSKAVSALHCPELSSLHITPLLETNKEEQQDIIIEPLLGFDRDIEILELLLIEGEEYFLQLFDENNSLKWSKKLSRK